MFHPIPVHASSSSSSWTLETEKHLGDAAASRWMTHLVAMVMGGPNPPSIGIMDGCYPAAVHDGGDWGECGEGLKKQGDKFRSNQFVASPDFYLD